MSAEGWTQVKWRRRVRDLHKQLGVSRVQAAALAGVITDLTGGNSRMQLTQAVIAKEAGLKVPTVRDFIRACYRLKLICWMGRRRVGRGEMDVHELVMPDPNRPPKPKPEEYVARQRANGARGAITVAEAPIVDDDEKVSGSRTDSPKPTTGPGPSEGELLARLEKVRDIISDDRQAAVEGYVKALAVDPDADPKDVPGWLADAVRSTVLT